jgi:hypothetical protein
MLTLRAVATTDGETSLHNPSFVPRWTATVLVVVFAVVGDEHEVANRAKPNAATK